MSTKYPRAYQVRRSFRNGWIAGGAVLSAVATGIATDAYLESADNLIPAMIVAGLFIFLSLGIVVSLTIARVVLTADAIEARGVFFTKRVLREEISGVRWSLMPNGPPRFKIHTRSATMAKISLPQALDTDAEFEAWMKGFPNLDEQEARLSANAYLAVSPVPGSIPEKMEHLESARRVARGLNAATCACAAWASIYPHPYDLALLMTAALPALALAIAVLGGGAYTFEADRNDVRANLSIAAVLPCLALLLRALRDVRLLDWEEMLWPTIGVWVVLAGLVLLVYPLRRRWESILGLSVFVLVYSYAAAALADREFDRSEPQVHLASVLDRRVGSGKSTTYYLDLAPWGPRKSRKSESVARELHERAPVGATVCVYLWSGALGARRYELDRCPGPPR